MDGGQRRPAPPVELRIWNGLSLALALLFFGLGALTRARWIAAPILVAFGGGQLVFGAMAAANRNGLADRLGRYHARRPALLGGFILNHHGLSWRLQGLGMMVFGAVLLVLATGILLR
jgi:hypothetical protein